MESTALSSMAVIFSCLAFRVIMGLFDLCCSSTGMVHDSFAATNATALFRPSELARLQTTAIGQRNSVRNIKSIPMSNFLLNLGYRISKRGNITIMRSSASQQWIALRRLANSSCCALDTEAGSTNYEVFNLFQAYLLVGSLLSIEAEWFFTFNECFFVALSPVSLVQ